MFDVEVWGTVSDWTIVLVTTVTAFFVWKTLDEQKKINTISINKDRRDIRPEFKISHQDSMFQLYVSNATAINVMIFNTDTFSKMVGEPEIIPIWHKEYNKLHIPVSFFDIDDRDYSIWIIRYNDEDGREYKQEVNGSFDGSVYIDFPILMKDVI